MQVFDWKTYLKPFLKVELPIKSVELLIVARKQYTPDPVRAVTETNKHVGAIAVPGTWDAENMESGVVGEAKVCFHPSIQKSSDADVLFPYKGTEWPIFLYFYWKFIEYDGKEFLIPRRGLAGVQIKDASLVFTLGQK